MDKFDEIKSDYETQRYHGNDAEYIAWFSHAEWLIAEVDRLRKIEDAGNRVVRYWKVVDETGATNRDHDSIQAFKDALAVSPRPEE